MRLALVLSRVPSRSEVRRFPLDDRSILDAVRSGHDVEAFVDLDTDGAEALRDAGAAVSVAPKRGAFTTGDGRVLTDRHTVATSMTAAHRDRPFDAILVSDDIPVDPAWYEPELAAIPRGVVLGAGPVGDHRLVFGHPGLSESFGMESWRITGVIGTADFVVSDADPSDYGLSGPLPPWFSWGTIPELAGPPSGGPAVAGVVALGETPVGYGTLAARVGGAVPIAETTTVVVVAPDAAVGGDGVGSLISAGIPAGRELNVIVAHPGSDGVAAALLGTADVIVAARPADLAAPILRDLDRPVVLLDGGPVRRTSPVWEETVTRRTQPGTSALVQGDGPRGDVIAAVEDAFAAGGERVVLYDAAAAPTALEIAGIPRLEGADLVVVGAASGIYGEPSLEEIAPGVVGVSRRCWPSVRRRLAITGSVWELQVWMLGLSSVPHATLAVVPGRSRKWESLPTANVTGIPTWVTSSGLLPVPDLSGIGIAREAVPPLGDEVTPETLVRRWVMQRSWAQRARLALPAKGGLLRRAMKGRW